MGIAGLLIDQLQVTASVGSVEDSNVLNGGFSSSGPVVKLSGAGHVTGGGQLGSRVSFGFNGVPTMYRIDAYDNAEPGRGIDMFAIAIAIASGYAVSGVIGQGNIQLHG